MLSLPPSCRIWLATRPTDMRKGMDGLLGEVRTRWDDDPFGGHLFIFPSRDASRVKILWWHDGGLCLFAKRLEKGRFRLPPLQPGQTSVALDAADLTMLLSGIDWTRARRQQLHEPPKPLAHQLTPGIDKRPEV